MGPEDGSVSKALAFQAWGLNSGPGRQVKMPGGAVLASHSRAEEMGTSGYLGLAVSLD